MFILLFTIILGYGETAFPLLRIPYGARAASLGEAYVALSDDGASLWWNPAGMVRLTHSEVFLSHHEWFAGIRDGVVGIVDVRKNTAIGVSYMGSWVSEIESWTEDNERDPQGYSEKSGIASLAGAYNINGVAAGATIKFFYTRLGGLTTSGWALDLGVQYSPLPEIYLGAVVQNIGPKLVYGIEKFPLPLTFRVGGHMEVSSIFNLVLDLSQGLYGRLLFHTGGELWTPDRSAAVRVGYRTGPQDRDLELGFFTFGICLRVADFSFDYAFIPYGKLGSTHRLWLSWRFKKLPERR